MSKPLSPSLRLAILFVVFGAVAPAKADDLRTIYVPFVSALGADGKAWQGSAGFFNNSNTPGTIALAAIYPREGASNRCVATEIAPRSGKNLVEVIWTCGGAGSPLAFLAFTLSKSIVVRADAQKVSLPAMCEGCYIDQPESWGEAPVPIFTGLFGTSQSAVSGPVELWTEVPGAGSSARHVRRVNVTLLNAGDAEGRFVVTVLPLRGSAGPISRQDVVIPGGSVVQLNSVNVPTSASPDLRYSNGLTVGYRVWFTITADQPFLSYVSTIYDDPAPGALPFEVYPSYVQN